MAGPMNHDQEKFDELNQEPECIGPDLNYDGRIDGKDLSIAGNALYWQGQGKDINIDDRCSRFDCNKDGKFDADDVKCVEGMVE